MGFLAILLWLFSLLALYLVVQWAIDGSKTAKNIQEIRDILVKQYPNSVERILSEEDYEINIEKLPVDECPACQAKISEDDQACPACGLNLECV